MAELTLLLAFLAGIISFLAPCVLPLIPGYLAYLAGASVHDENKRGIIFIHSICFVLGFALVFSLLGVLLNTVLANIAYTAQIWIARISGTLIILFGLSLTGIISIPWFHSEHKIVVKNIKPSYLRSVVFGIAFGAGWTPCVGPTLGAILGLATAEPGSAFSLLLAYSLGLGVPFLVVGLLTEKAARIIQQYSTGLNTLQKIFGAILIILGILVFTQRMDLLINWNFLNKLLLQ